MSTVPPQSPIVVRQVQADEVDLFLDLYQDGFELPRLDDWEKGAVRTWFESARSELCMCIARIEGTPAGVGILYVKDGIGLLADAATRPEFRGRGCYAALLHYRITHAAERGCDLLTSFVAFGSTSHRNLERARLRVAYTKALWWRV